MRPYRVRELRVTYGPHPSGATADARQLLQPFQTAAIVMPMLQHEAQEVMICLLLTTKYRLIAVHEVSRGGIDSTLVDPFVIYRAALLANAPALILAHNHPSGDPTPSPDDIALTRRLQEGGRLLNIQILDHLIIGERSYCSFKETGRL